MAEKASVKLTAIYALSDCDGAIRYVGKADNPFERAQQHYRDAKAGRRPLHCWIRDERSAGRAVHCHVIEWVPVEHWQAAERRWIAEHRKSGSLVNVAKGGNQPAQPVGAARRAWALKKKMSASWRTMPEEAKARIAECVLERAKVWAKQDQKIARHLNNLGVCLP